MLNTFTKLLRKPISGFADLNLLLSAVTTGTTRATICASAQNIIKDAKEKFGIWSANPIFNIQFDGLTNKFIITITLKKIVYGEIFLVPEDESCNSGVLNYLETHTVPH